jgi:hypothetical protein
VEHELKNESLPSHPGVPTTAPNPVANTLDSSNPAFNGFDGLSIEDNVLAGTGIYAGSQGILEPSDQALCAGNGMVPESVNTVLAVYSPSGAILSGPTALNQFYNLKPVFGADGSFGDFLSDPKCLYDASIGRWILTILQADVDPATGDFTGESSVLIAVTTTSDPRGT